MRIDATVTSCLDEAVALNGCLRISGWAVDPDEALVAVTASVDGGAQRRLRIGIERPDAALRFPGVASAIVAGFEETFDAAELGTGDWSIEIRTHRGDGTSKPLGTIRGPRPARDERRPVRLTAFTHRLDIGGGQLYLTLLLERLSRAGVHCTVISPLRGELTDDLDRAGATTVISPIPDFASPSDYERWVAATMARVGELRPDVIIVNTLESFGGADVADRLGVPFLWAIHESYGFPGFWAASPSSPIARTHPLVRARAEGLVARATATVFEADTTRCLYPAAVAAGGAVVVPYGPPAELVRGTRGRAEARAALGVAEASKLVVCVGVIDCRKAQTVLVQAFARVAYAHPGAELALVGAADSPYSRALIELSGRLAMTGRCRIEPVSRAPLDWLAAADVVVCPSDVESLPMVILEAMHLGRCVVASDIFGVPEVVVEAETGFLCRARDIGDLARALDAVLLLSGGQRDAIGAAGQRLVGARYQADACAAAFLRMIAASREGTMA